MAVTRGLLITENHALGATLSGGAFEVLLPRGNLLEPEIIGKPARVTDASDKANSVIDVDLGAVKRIRFIGLFGTTLTASSQVRVTVSNESDFDPATTVIGWQDVVTRAFDSLSLPWSDPRWWTGKPSTEEARLWGAPVVIVPDLAIEGRYVRIEIDDEANPDDLDLGYLVIGDGVVPVRTYDYGREFGLLDASREDSTQGGVVVTGPGDAPAAACPRLECAQPGRGGADPRCAAPARQGRLCGLRARLGSGAFSARGLCRAVASGEWRRAAPRRVPRSVD